MLQIGGGWAGNSMKGPLCSRTRLARALSYASRAGPHPSWPRLSSKWPGPRSLQHRDPIEPAHPGGAEASPAILAAYLGLVPSGPRRSTTCTPFALAWMTSRSSTPLPEKATR